MAYSLHVVKSNHYGGRAVVQSSLMFPTADGRRSPDVKDDCIEVHVYRVQKRRRIRQLALDPPVRQQLQEQGQGAVR